MSTNLDSVRRENAAKCAAAYSTVDIKWTRIADAIYGYLLGGYSRHVAVARALQRMDCALREGSAVRITVEAVVNDEWKVIQ